MQLAKFYQIIDDTKWLDAFLPLGLSLVQLRIKDVPLTQVKQQIRAAKTACDAAHCQLIINDYWQIAIDEGCDYIHLGQEDLANAELSTIKHHGLKLGISTHDTTELETALNAEPDYIALGPIYPTILKKMAWQPQGLKKIQQWKKAIGDIPLVAIGGLSIERATAVYQAGADSICVVTDVLYHDNPTQRVQQWLGFAHD